MNFDQMQNLYAQLLVEHGLGVQTGQLVNISAEVSHREFVIKVVEAAYKAGAKHVDVDLVDPRIGRLRIDHSTAENLEYVPDYLSQKFRTLLDDCGANLKLIGPEFPQLMADADPKSINITRKASYTAMKFFYDEGIGKSRVHWTVAAVPTVAWAQRIFPELEAAAAYDALWSEVLKIVHADQEDCLELWHQHNAALHARAKKLTELKIKELHFQGPGTDLLVGLSDQAIWRGGSDRSPRGADFEPNIPTEEVFTTPDYRLTQGKVRATRPFLVNGKMVEGLEMEFEAGVLKNFNATNGAETYKEYIDSDEGGRRLGEVALVGIDSPIFQSGRVFEEILFDENAACHIAVGSAYKFCLDGGENMSDDEIAALGCNESSVHTDMMISSQEVEVTATTFTGDKVPIIVAGEWAI